MNLKEIASEVENAARIAARFIHHEAKTFDKLHVSDKGINQLVSYVDVTAEKMLVERLSAVLPEAGFITEENTSDTGRRELNWVIDPLDGTTNFIHGVPVYSVSLALLKGNEELIGVVYEIGRDESFVAWKDGGAYLNGNPIRVAETKALKQSLLATGFPYYDFIKMQDYMSVLQEYMRGCHGIRRMGSAAVDLAYVACGRFEGFWEYGLNAWDIAAGSLLVKEAGGVVCDFKRGDKYLFGKQILACCPGIFEEFVKPAEERLAM